MNIGGTAPASIYSSGGMINLISGADVDIYNNSVLTASGADVNGVSINIFSIGDSDVNSSSLSANGGDLIITALGAIDIGASGLCMHRRWAEST